MHNYLLDRFINRAYHTHIWLLGWSKLKCMFWEGSLFKLRGV